MNTFSKYYLLFSIRIVAYSSIAFFSSIIEPFLSKLFQANLGFILFLFNVLFFEFSRLYLKKTYKPNYAVQGSPEAIKKTKLIAMSQADYDYRLQGEIYIQSLIIYYLMNLILSLTINYFFRTGNYKEIIYGIVGLPISLINFFGIALMVSKTKSRSTSIFLKFMGLGYQLFAWIYIYFSFIFYKPFFTI